MSKKGFAVFVMVIGVVAVLLFWLSRNPPGMGGSGMGPEIKLNQAQLLAAWPVLIKLSPSGPFGNPKAPWTVVEVGDFQCPNCGDAEPLVKNAIEASKGKAKMYFVNYPLPKIHPNALVAAEAGEAAGAQGKFWQMYDLLYGHQDELIDSEIEYNARGISGLDTGKLTQAMTSHQFRPAIAAQAKAVETAGITTVPTVVVMTPSGKVLWYCGTRGSKSVNGIDQFAANYPWGGGIGLQSADQILRSERNARMGVPGAE